MRNTSRIIPNLNLKDQPPNETTGGRTRDNDGSDEADYRRHGEQKTFRQDPPDGREKEPLRGPFTWRMSCTFPLYILTLLVRILLWSIVVRFLGNGSYICKSRWRFPVSFVSSSVSFILVVKILWVCFRTQRGLQVSLTLVFGTGQWVFIWW